jgi:hypothetical protein
MYVGFDSTTVMQVEPASTMTSCSLSGFNFHLLLAKGFTRLLFQQSVTRAQNRIVSSLEARMEVLDWHLLAGVQFISVIWCRPKSKQMQTQYSVPLSYMDARVVRNQMGNCSGRPTSQRISLLSSNKQFVKNDANWRLESSRWRHRGDMERTHN